ncbi:MAG: fibronectin type III domain-containing protein, partial [Paludibacteraceae bacterium]|nr:fibronectin type III domain-containing protein [Paludibacteraceae bacterium]
MKNSTFLIKAKFFLLSIACFLTLTANASPLCNQVFNEQADHASPDANFTFETIKDGLGNNVRLKITLDCPDPSVTEFHFREGFQLKEAFPNYLASNIAVSESGNYTTGTKELYVDFATPYPEDGATFSFVVQVGWYVNVGGTEYQPWDAYTRYHYTIGTDCSTTVHKMCDGLTVIGNNAASAAYLEAKSIGTAGSYTGVDLILHNYNASDPDGSTYWRNSLPALSVPGTWTMTTTNTTNDTFHYEFDTPQAGNTTFSLPQVEYRTAGNTNAYVNDASINFMFTLGAVCDVDDENPVLVTANPTKVGNYGFSLDLESTDNKNLALYEITGNDSNGNPFTVNAAINGTTHQSELYFALPDGIKITSSISATVKVKDRSGNQDSKVVTLTPNMVAPTLNSVACYDATNTSITLKVDAISNNASSKVEKCHVTYGGNSKIVPLTVYNPSLSTITIDGLTKGTNYTFTVTAIGKFGEASTTTASASCSTTSNAEHCGVILANGGQPYVNIPHLNSRAIYWLTKSGTNELTLLVTHYPGTEEITGLYINTNGQNVNPAVPANSWADGVVPINVDAHNGVATATSNLTADLFSVSNETVTFDGHPAQNAIKITFKYSEATTTFNQLYLRWHKPGKEYVTDGGGIIHFSTSDLGCDLSNLNALNVEWGENGNPAHFNPATNLANQAIDDTPIEGSCGDMIWGTSFSSSTTSTHNVIDGVDVENNIGFYTLKIGDAFPEGYSNGNFMDVGRSYTIVSDPKVLDEKLSERTDGTNRLIYNLGDSMDSPEQLFLLTLRNMEVGSKVTVTFDLEDLNPNCYVYDDGLTFNRVFHVGVGETSTAIYLAPNGKQTVRIEATATDKVASHFPVFMSTWQTRDCAAIAISNLRVYGCSAHTIETGNLVSTMSCEGSEVELTAVGYGSATTGFTWEESTDKISWTPISGTSNTNEVIPILDVTTYYRVTHGGIVSNIIEITGVVCCDDANSYEVYSEDFGTVGPWERKPYDGVQGHYFADYMVFCGNNTPADCGYSGCEYQWIPKTVADGIHAINVDGTIYQTCDEIQVAKTNGFIAPGADPY